MTHSNMTHVSRKPGKDGWHDLTVERHRKAINGRYKTKHQITIELGEPYTETITIESTEPFADVDDFAREILIAAKYRHQARRKQFIDDNREILRTTIVPLWLEREAFCAEERANVENLRKESKRKLAAGLRDLKSHNALVIALKGATKDDEYNATLSHYNRRIDRELEKIGASEGFNLSRYELNELFDRKWWETSLQINEYRDKNRLDVVSKVKLEMGYFNSLYGLEPHNPTTEDILGNYDAIVTAGFGDIILAAALKKGDGIGAVMAIDDEQGRRALRHLVGEKRLATMLPKRVFNAITRHETPELKDISYHADTQKDTLIIE